MMQKLMMIPVPGDGDDSQHHPLVIVAHSTREKPYEGGLKDLANREVRIGPDRLAKARFYYVEVGIGNLAWHWIRLAVYEVDGRTRVDVLERAVS